MRTRTWLTAALVPVLALLMVQGCGKLCASDVDCGEGQACSSAQICVDLYGARGGGAQHATGGEEDDDGGPSRSGAGGDGGDGGAEDCTEGECEEPRPPVDCSELCSEDPDADDCVGDGICAGEGVDCDPESDEDCMVDAPDPDGGSSAAEEIPAECYEYADHLYNCYTNGDEWYGDNYQGTHDDLLDSCVSVWPYAPENIRCHIATSCEVLKVHGENC